MIILAIDPGTAKSGWVIASDTTHPVEILDHGIDANKDVRRHISTGFIEPDVLVVEKFVHYGKSHPIGESTITSILWAGRFIEAAQPAPHYLYSRQDVRRALAIKGSINDTAVRQALLDILGPKGTKANPGPCYGIASHMWSALALAVTHIYETEEE